ncbi:MAG: M24 family metallopeptidase [Gemmatimonadales bacterium]
MSLATLDRSALSQGLKACGADGWLLYNFKGINPVADRLLALGGLGSRRLFVLLTPDKPPVALAHKIEMQPMQGFPGTVIAYARWQELHEGLRKLVAGRTLAMEVSPGNGVPYLDRVPHGVVQLIEELGGRVVGSAPLVTEFTARWSADEARSHREVAEILARIARDALRYAVQQGGSELRETTLQRRVVEAMEREQIIPDHPPIIAFGPNAADGHYEPMEGRDRALSRDEIVLIDLFGRRSGFVSADQTWMGFSGAAPPEKVRRVWTTVRDARDAALDVVRRAGREGRTLAGWEVDRAARDVIEKAGFGDFFVHRTGHSIDQDLHGSGPHMDDYETRDDRAIIAGCGFSVEPGIYLPGEFGVRSEVNVWWSPDGPIVTPTEPQVDLVLP